MGVNFTSSFCILLLSKMLLFKFIINNNNDTTIIVRGKLDYEMFELFAFKI